MLADYGLGKLDSAGSETIHQHLETCSDCRSVVASTSGASLVNPRRSDQARPLAVAAPAQRTRTFAIGESIPNAAGNSETPPPASGNRELSGASFAGNSPASGSPGLANVPSELANHPDYEFLKELGHGGMGTVYLARNQMMDRLEVLKVVSKSLLDRPGALERFQQEIRSAAKLAHPNIVAAYSVLRPGDLLVFAMEYVDGQDLSQVVKQRGALPVTNATFYIQQVALGLQHAHDKGMVHRDIKPNNLMLAIVNKKHVVKILDFGLAKATSEKLADGGLTKSGQMMGTPDYIAPEQTLDAQKADIRADIYSLGCTLYYLLAGHVPFQGNSLYEILQAHHQKDARQLNLERPEVPAELVAIVSKMMAKDPAKRFQTPMEVAKALNPFFKAGISLRLRQRATPHQSAAPGDFSNSVPIAAGHSTGAAPRPVPIAAAIPISAIPVASLAAPADAGATTKQRKPPAKKRGHNLAMPIAVGLLLVAIGIVGAVMFKFRTADGVVAIEVNEPNPEIFVDGNKATVTWDAGGMKAEITLPAGARKIELKKDGFKATGETVEIEHGSRRVLAARLEPLNSNTTTTPVATLASPAAVPLQTPEPTITPSALSLATPSDGFVSLFNGKDLTGWFVDDDNGDQSGWSVLDDNIEAAGLDYRSVPTGIDYRTRSYLLTDRDYADFVLRAEFNLAPRSGGGVALRAVPGEKLPTENGLKFDHPMLKLIEQTNERAAKNGENTGTAQWVTDQLYAPPISPPLATPSGMWNRLEIEVRGHTIRATVNGKLVVDRELGSNARLSDGQLPGLNRVRGRIGFQKCSGTIRYRNIEVKDLSPVNPASTASPSDSIRQSIPRISPGKVPRRRKMGYPRRRARPKLGRSRRLRSLFRKH